ncbi:MAG: hypothetical protein U9N61_10430 [Euryarchaeota archaeon]|nr:hypothetical protein [Euryarchaeota archaeon]
MRDLRWRKEGEPMTYIDTLRAMCDWYGSFCGRWHSNEFWKRTKAAIGSMTEEQAKEKVFAIEDEANTNIARWRQSQ